MVNNKYKMFKNFMFNELGISKEDIRDWIKEAVHEEAQKLINNAFEFENPRTTLRRLIINDSFFSGESLKRDILQETAKILADRLIITTKDNES